MRAGSRETVSDEHGARPRDPEEEGPARWPPCGSRPVQLRHATALTSDQYVSQQAWWTATLKCCPLHPQGGCGLARHTAYERAEPPGMQVARYYCRKGHTTFSLLPDCLASRLSSTLVEVQQVVVAAEAAPSLEQAAVRLRPDIETQGGLRWVRRRLWPIRVALLAIATLLPGTLEGIGSPASLTAVQRQLGPAALVQLRDIAGSQLRSLPPPLGLGPRTEPRRSRRHGSQQEAGADPPRDRR